MAQSKKINIDDKQANKLPEANGWKSRMLCKHSFDRYV